MSAEKPEDWEMCAVGCEGECGACQRRRIRTAPKCATMSMLEEVDRLKVRNRKLVEVIRAAVTHADMNPVTRAHLRAAIEEDADGK